MTNIVFKPKNTVNVKVKDTAGIITPSPTGTTTLSNFRIPNRIVDLIDVSLTDKPPIEGSTLVYNDIENVFEVKLIDNYVNLDGGIF